MPSYIRFQILLPMVHGRIVDKQTELLNSSRKLHMKEQFQNWLHSNDISSFMLAISSITENREKEGCWCQYDPKSQWLNFNFRIRRQELPSQKTYRSKCSHRTLGSYVFITGILRKRSIGCILYLIIALFPFSVYTCS